MVLSISSNNPAILSESDIVAFRYTKPITHPSPCSFCAFPAAILSNLPGCVHPAKSRRHPGIRFTCERLLALLPRKTPLNAKLSQENFKVDIFKAEKTGNLRKVPEVVFLRRKSVPHRPAATREGSERSNSPVDCCRRQSDVNESIETSNATAPREQCED